MNITENEILEALRAAAVVGDTADGSTCADLCRALGWGEKRVRRYLIDLKRDGKVELVTVTRETLDGRRAAVPAYRIVPRAPLRVA